MKKVVKRLFNNDKLVSVRDYEVKECLDKDEVMHIWYKDKVMSLDPHSLRTMVVMTSKVIPNKIDGGRSYRLVSFEWLPNITVPND